MKKTAYDIFISYRRDTGADTAKHLRDVLVSKGYSVFFDTDSLRSGSFNHELISVINNCKDFILILSPNSLDRCINENDWVRQEIACALNAGKNIIPVMSGKFSFPEELPSDINDVRWKNGVTVNIEYFDAMVEKLQSFLQSKPQKKKILFWLLPTLIVCILLIAAMAFLFNQPANNKEIPETTISNIPEATESVISDEYIKQTSREGIAAFISKDYMTALERLQEAAALNDPDALYYLGQMYQYGFGVKQSYEKAIQYYQKPADMGYVSAQVALGQLLYSDMLYEEALKYLQPAADQGNSNAQFAIGMMYNFGNGVNRSFEKAKEYYELAAAQDNAIALKALGYLYEEGMGVEQSFEKALEYYRLSVQMGNQSAKEDIERIENRETSSPVSSSKPSVQADNTSSEGSERSSTKAKETNTNNNENIKNYSTEAINEFCKKWKEYYSNIQMDLTFYYTEPKEFKYINAVYNNANNEIDYHAKLIPSNSAILFAYNPMEQYFGFRVFSNQIDYTLKNVRIDIINKEIKENEISNVQKNENSWGFSLNDNEVYNLYAQDGFTIILTTESEKEEIVISKSEKRVFYDMVMLLKTGSWYCEVGNERYMDKELLPANTTNKENENQDGTGSYSFKNDYDALEKAAQSSFYVEMYGPDGEWLGTTASGFVSFDEHLFVTNQHVIDGASFLKIWDEKDNMYILDKVIVSDKTHDIAILLFPDGGKYTSLKQRDTLDLRRGQTVMTIGSPKGLQGSVDDGVISSFPEMKQYDGLQCIQFSASISPGSSGGALFDNEGYVIGITTSSITDGQNLNFAIPITEVQKLYAQWDKKSSEVLGTERSWDMVGNSKE